MGRFPNKAFLWELKDLIPNLAWTLSGPRCFVPFVGDYNYDSCFIQNRTPAGASHLKDHPAKPKAISLEARKRIIAPAGQRPLGRIRTASRDG